MGSRSGFDFDVDAGRKVQLHQRVERLLRRLEDVEQALDALMKLDLSAGVDVEIKT